MSDVWLAILKKWWWVLLLGVAIVGMAIAEFLFGANDPGAAAKILEQTKENVRDADTDAIIAKALNSTEFAEKRGALGEVKKIPDGQQRRQRLAEVLDRELDSL